MKKFNTNRIILQWGKHMKADIPLTLYVKTLLAIAVISASSYLVMTGASNLLSVISGM